MNPLAIMQPGIGYEDCSPTPRSPTPRPDSNSSTRRRSSLFHIGDIHMRNERKSLLREGSNSSLKTGGKSKRRSRSPFGGRRRTSLPHVKAPKEQQATATVQELDDDKQSSRRRSLFHIQDQDATVTPPGTRHDSKAERRKNRRRRSSLFHVNQLTQGNGRSNSTGRALRADDDRSVTSNKSNKSLNSSLSLFSGKNPFTRNRGQDHSHPHKRRSHKDKMDKSMKEHSNSTRATELMDRSSKDHSTSSHNSGRSGRHHRRHHSSSNLKGAEKDHSRRSSRRHSDGHSSKRRSKSGNNRVLSADDELTKNMKDMEKLVQALQKSPESRKILQEHLHKKQPQNFAPVGYVSAPRGT